MQWNTLSDVRRDTRIEFTRALVLKHSFVWLLSGKWVRVLGAPDKNCVHIRGRIYHEVSA